MSDSPDEKIAAIRARLLSGMASYMEGDDEFPAEPGCGYTQAEIEECASIVDSYLESLSDADAGRILELVQSTVERLNALNDRCDGALIETDQREHLCQIILVAARQAGLPTTDDVTEEWREW